MCSNLRTLWLPHSAQRDSTELEVQCAKGTALLAFKGYAAREVSDTYTRAKTLWNQLGCLSAPRSQRYFDAAGAAGAGLGGFTFAIRRRIFQPLLSRSKTMLQRPAR